MTVGGTGTAERLQPAKGIAASKMITESARIRRFASLSLIDFTSLQIAYPSSKLSRYSWRMSIESESVSWDSLSECEQLSYGSQLQLLGREPLSLEL